MHIAAAGDCAQIFLAYRHGLRAVEVVDLPGAGRPQDGDAGGSRTARRQSSPSWSEPVLGFSYHGDAGTAKKDHAHRGGRGDCAHDLFSLPAWLRAAEVVDLR